MLSSVFDRLFYTQPPSQIPFMKAMWDCGCIKSWGFGTSTPYLSLNKKSPSPRRTRFLVQEFMGMGFFALFSVSFLAKFRVPNHKGSEFSLLSNLEIQMHKAINYVALQKQQNKKK